MKEVSVVRWWNDWLEFRLRWEMEERESPRYAGRPPAAEGDRHGTHSCCHNSYRSNILEEGDERHSLLPPSSLCFCLISARTRSSLLAPTHTETVSFIPQVNQRTKLSQRNVKETWFPLWYFETWLLHNRWFKNGRRKLYVALHNFHFLFYPITLIRCKCTTQSHKHKFKLTLWNYFW